MARSSHPMRLLWPHCLPAPPVGAAAQDKVLNLYSARHYQTDEALYANFTKATGIKINRIDADDAGVVTRLQAEGAASPADVVLLVDAARLTKAEADGLFQPVNSACCRRASRRICAMATTVAARSGSASRRARGSSSTTRPRCSVPTSTPTRSWRTRRTRARCALAPVLTPTTSRCSVRCCSTWGRQATEAWLKGVVDNMARPPKGGDTDQIKAVASGECAIALTNSYYLARLMRSTKPEDVETMSKVAVVFPNQQSWGTHVNMAGGAVAKHAKNRGRGGGASWNTWPATRRSSTSPTATTNGRRWPR